MLENEIFSILFFLTVLLRYGIRHAVRIFYRGCLTLLAPAGLRYSGSLRADALASNLCGVASKKSLTLNRNCLENEFSASSFFLAFFVLWFYHTTEIF